MTSAKRQSFQHSPCGPLASLYCVHYPTISLFHYLLMHDAIPEEGGGGGGGDVDIDDGGGCNTGVPAKTSSITGNMPVLDIR
jgi:hypothetical protein